MASRSTITFPSGDSECAAWAFRPVRGLTDVDTDRIAIWGSSFGGGHVLEIAARDAVVAAVVSQNPFTDGPASVLAANRLSVLRATVPAVRDEVARLTGSAPVLLPVIGPPGSAALMATDDAESGYLGIVPPGLDFVNGVAARFLLPCTPSGISRSTQARASSMPSPTRRTSSSATCAPGRNRLTSRRRRRACLSGNS